MQYLMKNTLEGIKGRLDEIEDQISELKDKAEKEHTVTATK